MICIHPFDDLTVRDEIFFLAKTAGSVRMV